MKRLILMMGACISICSATDSLAASNPSLVIQIPQTFYDHPVRLLQIAMAYWHNRGTAAAEVGMQEFQAQHFNTSSCQSDATGQALVVIEPNMFYNPKMGIYYSEITAKVYNKPTADSALGNPVLTFKGQGQTFGNITHNVEFFTHKAYQQAFDQVISQLEQNITFKELLSQAPSQSFQALCTSINTTTQSKMFF